MAKENQDERNKNKGEIQTEAEDVSLLLLTFPFVGYQQTKID